MGIREVTYYEAWCDHLLPHRLEDGEYTAHGDRDSWVEILTDSDDILLPDGRVFCLRHLPADICPDNLSSDAPGHEWDDDPDPVRVSCVHCGAEREYLTAKATCEQCGAAADHDTELCCSSHNKRLCHACYRTAHFVQVCHCKRAACQAERAA